MQPLHVRDFLKSVPAIWDPDFPAFKSEEIPLENGATPDAVRCARGGFVLTSIVDQCPTLTFLISA